MRAVWDDRAETRRIGCADAHCAMDENGADRAGHGEAGPTTITVHVTDMPQSTAWWAMAGVDTGEQARYQCGPGEHVAVSWLCSTGAVTDVDLEHGDVAVGAAWAAACNTAKHIQVRRTVSCSVM